MFNELPALPEFKEEMPYKKHDVPTRITFGKEWTTAELKDAVGKRAFNQIGVYPPGVPLIYDGDVIDQEAAKYLSLHADKTFGLENGRVRVLK